jgi:hypothetical protein
MSGAERKKSDPTKDPEFQRVLKNLLSTPHKPQSEMKVGAKPKGKVTKKKAPPDRLTGA